MTEYFERCQMYLLFWQYLGFYPNMESYVSQFSFPFHDTSNKRAILVVEQVYVVIQAPTS